MRRESLVASGKRLSIERIEREDLFRRRWLAATLRRIILPEPVIFTRLAIAVCVFSFCFMTVLSTSRGTTCMDRALPSLPSPGASRPRALRQDRCMEIDVCKVMAIQSHRYSFEGAEKPVSGVNPACAWHYTIRAWPAQYGCLAAYRPLTVAAPDARARLPGAQARTGVRGRAAGAARGHAPPARRDASSARSKQKKAASPRSAQAGPA